MDDSYAIATPNNDYYNQLYAEFNPQGVPRVGAAEAANYLKTSNLPMPTLGQIWALSDSSKQGSLDKRGAFVAFKLVAAAQQGKPISSSVLYDGSIAPPRFGAPIPPVNQQHHFQPSFPSVGRAPPIPPAPSAIQQNGLPVDWPITEADQNKYNSIFLSLNPINDKLSGASVRPVLINSGLDPVSLARIWELSDQDKDGCLDRVEMSIALHLVYRALQSEPIPAQLPPNLIHPSKAGLSPSTLPYAPRPSLGSRAGSVTSLDEVHMNMAAHRSAPPPPRAHSAAVNYNGSVSGASTPMSANFPVSPSHGSLNSSWPVNTADFAAQFAQCDTNSDGLVDGQDIRAPLLSTGLNPPLLAQIWALVDIRKCGQLNLEQFSLIMYLIESAKRGETVPLELPAHLIPPSFREQPAHVVAAPTQGVVSVSTPQLAEATSMEIKEALEGDNEDMKQLAEAIQSMLIDRTKTEESVLQLETDMDAKNAKIKNLQVELQTLESTVKQLERQKMEATRRLNDYDSQIQQLEAACQAQREKKEETEKRMKQIEEDSKNAEESANADQKEMEELRKEIGELESSYTAIRVGIQKEEFENANIVEKQTNLEKRETRDNRQMTLIAQEIENVQKMNEEIVAAVEDENEKNMESRFREKPTLLTTTLNNTLMSDDTVYGEPSTSQQQQQQIDPFAQARTNQAADPFAQVDPFASQGSFAAAFPSDPFAQGFPADAGFDASASAANKPPPPRPAPPKSARATPVNNDPFAPSQGAVQQTANFANFADFGSAFN